MRNIDFRDLTKDDKPVVDKFYRSGYYENSHFNFTNLYMWRKPFQIRTAVEDDVLFLTCLGEDGALTALQPIGPMERMDDAVARLMEHFGEEGRTLRFSGVERSFAEVLENYGRADFDIWPDRDNFDYVYSSESLMKLAGRKYHSKKNHLNAFRKMYPQAEYLPITEEIITLCKLELNSWYKLRSQEEPDDPFIGHERAAIIEVLNNFQDFGLKGGAIRLDNRIVAFTFGEQLNADTAVIHVEKADPEVRGAYPAINQGFVEHEWSHLAYINREEDMGIDGLRKAKESYKPVKMIEKFWAARKE